MKKTIILLLILLFLPLVNASTYHMKLLTVSEAGNRTGGIADLYLELKPGTGRIFIDSFPLSKLDTQIVTRFSNEIACDFLQVECSEYDFFYTIRANTAVVGGPSAGAAMTVLTITALEDISLNESVIMTGTINSGGLIGAVGGIKEKTEAAQKHGLKKVLIPRWSVQANDTNESMNYSNFVIDVVEVSTIEEALYHFTGKSYAKPDRDIDIPGSYSRTMEDIAIQLCNRTIEINDSLDQPIETNSSLYNSSLNYINKSKFAMENKDFYSAASFCFSANLKLKTLSFKSKDNEELLEIKRQVQAAIDITNKRLENNFELHTIGDLETFMVVKERLVEAQDFLDGLNESNISYRDLAYANERYYSAASWSAFYGVGGKEFELDHEQLRKGCSNKLAEAEERISYVRIYLPEFLLEETQRELDHAYNDYRDDEFALCMFKASKAKAEANAMMTLLAIKTEDALKDMLKEKTAPVKQTILREQDKGVFPILGYSYYEYSGYLIEDQPYTALTFTEYALEMSNLDIYFPKKEEFAFPKFDMQLLIVLVVGLIIGFVAGVLVNRKRPKRKKK